MDREFLLLLREGHLIHATLAAGLNSLRKATLETKGEFYVAFFNLSTALERMMKLIIILNWLNEGARIDRKRIRQLGHSLVKLFQEVEQIAVMRGKEGLFRDIHSPSVPWEMLSILDEFARFARYANIDALLDQNVEFRDPLDSWHRKVSMRIFMQLPERVKQTIIHNAAQIGSALLPNTVVLMTGFSGELIDLDTMAFLGIAYEKIAPRAVWHVTRIVYPLAEMIVSFNYLMEDFFVDFSLNDRERIMRKQQWP